MLFNWEKQKKERVFKKAKTSYKLSFNFKFIINNNNKYASWSQEPEEELEADPLDHAGQDQGLQEAEETEIETDRQGDAEIALQEGRLQLDFKNITYYFQCHFNMKEIW